MCDSHHEGWDPAVIEAIVIGSTFSVANEQVLVRTNLVYAEGSTKALGRQ